jgi:hypothetical protein
MGRAQKKWGGHSAFEPIDVGISLSEIGKVAYEKIPGP